MADIDLSSSQKQILTALVDLYKQKDDVVKGKEIAERIDRNPGTIRNQMQSLKALQLVEGIPGPKGGYKPTAEAYESLDIEQMDEPATVPLYRNGERVEDANVSQIGFTSVHHPSALPDRNQSTGEHTRVRGRRQRTCRTDTYLASCR